MSDAHKGTLEIDLRIMNQFGEQPQEVQDFYVACRAAMTGKNPDPDVADTCQKFGRSKLGGPMLGDLSSTSVSVWIHLPEPDVVNVTVTPKAGGASNTFQSGRGKRVLTVRCEGLSRDTAYSYTVHASNNMVLGRSWAFGAFSFSKHNGKPRVDFRLINEQGNVLETVTL